MTSLWKVSEFSVDRVRFFSSWIPVYKIFQSVYKIFQSGFSFVMGKGRWQWEENGVSGEFFPSSNQPHGFVRNHDLPQACFTYSTHLITTLGEHYNLGSSCTWKILNVYCTHLTFLLPSSGKTRFSKAIGHLFLTKP